MSSQPEVRNVGGNGSAFDVTLEFERPLVRIEREIAELEAAQAESKRDLSNDIQELRGTLESLTKRTYAKLSPWETVLVARHPRRPVLADYISGCVKDFCELRGDRCFGDDPAVVTGFGRIGGQKVMLIGQEKGRETKEKIFRNFGCAHPEGYRKALHKMKLAEKFKLPVVSIIDTQGAYPGDKAEERGIAQSIAVNMMEMSRLRVPIICVVIGEGGSGGAIGIGVGDRLAMFEHTYYSVITPEGCAAILYKSATHADKAARSLGLTAKDLKQFNIVDDILPEPLGGGHRDPGALISTFENYVTETLRDLKRVRIDTLLNRRYEKIRQMGSYFESATGQACYDTSESSGRNGSNGRSNGRAHGRTRSTRNRKTTRANSSQK
jgi:acetyl-CoA carboxylase carboxyl transferase subunit alpha